MYCIAIETDDSFLSMNFYSLVASCLSPIPCYSRPAVAQALDRRSSKAVDVWRDLGIVHERRQGVGTTQLVRLWRDLGIVHKRREGVGTTQFWRCRGAESRMVWDEEWKFKYVHIIFGNTINDYDMIL